MNRTAAGRPATTETSTRRTLLGASLVAAVSALVAGREVAATAPPSGGSGSDDLLATAMAVELTARDLYRAAIDAGADPELLTVIAKQHASYGQSIAGYTGSSANRRDDGLFESLEASFATSDLAAVADAGFELESALVATHTEMLAEVDDVDAAKLVASIISAEARTAIVLADVAGNGDDLDLLLASDASPISSEESA